MNRTSAFAFALAMAGTAACSGAETARVQCDDGPCAAGTVTFAAEVASLTGARVEAVAITPEEPPWFAGTFDADARIAAVPLSWDEVGYLDPFLARTGVDELPPLVVDNSAGYPQRVVGVVPDAEDGALVLTIGPQGDGRHRFEAAWFDRGGRLVVRDTVALLDDVGPLGGAAVATDARGWPIVAASGTNVDVDEVLQGGEGAIVMRLGQGLRQEILIWLLGVDIADVAVDDDLLVIAGSYVAQPGVPDGSAPWPACPDPDPCGFVAAVALSSGLVHWVQPLRATGGATVHAVAVGSGQVVAMASTAGPAIDPPLGAGALPAYLITLDAVGQSGQPILLDQTILAEAGTTIGGRELAIADDGAVVIALGYRGDVLVGSQPVPYDRADETFASVVAELGTDLIWQWQLFLADQNVNVLAVATRGDQVAFGGVYRGTLAPPNPLQVALPAPTEVDNGFVLELHR